MTEKFSKTALKWWMAISADNRGLLLNNVWCPDCGTSVTICDFSMETAGKDLVLKGFCATCGHKVARVVEGGAIRKESVKKQTKKIYQFKIVLEEIKPPIWRRIHVRSDISLHRLSTTILIAMGWGGGHLHQFEIDGKSYGISDDDFDSEEDMLDERGFRLDDLDQGALKSFTFEYDFGDGWRHTVELEEVLAQAKGQKYPLCISGARQCPPDDCGGVPGYEKFLEAIRNPKHPEHKSMKEWIGGSYDPEWFCLDAVNCDLGNVAKTEKYRWR
jgi:hypothetical protein